MAVFRDEEDLRTRARNFALQNLNAIVRDIKTLVDIPSVEAPALPHAPFGKAVGEALAQRLSPIWMLCRAATAGRTTRLI